MAAIIASLFIRRAITVELADGAAMLGMLIEMRIASNQINLKGEITFIRFVYV
jgi:hypothetical protein